MDHIAISMAPVSEPGTTATRYPAGKPKMRAVSEHARLSAFLPNAERCERPKVSSFKLLRS